MSLQTRLSSLITAIGADIKSLNTKLSNPSFSGFGNQQPHGTYTDFNNLPDYGWRYVQGNLNGPGIPGGTEQYYVESIGLGSEYTYAQYAYQIAFKRGVPGSMATRHREAGVWTAWKIMGDFATYDGGAP